MFSNPPQNRGDDELFRKPSKKEESKHKDRTNYKSSLADSSTKASRELSPRDRRKVEEEKRKKDDRQQERDRRDRDRNERKREDEDRERRSNRRR